MLNSELISERINRKLKSIGIEPMVNGEPSHTANLVSLIVEEIIRGIITQAEVDTIVNTTGPALQPGSIETHQGTGYGRPGSIK